MYRGSRDIEDTNHVFNLVMYRGSRDIEDTNHVFNLVMIHITCRYDPYYMSL